MGLFGFFGGAILSLWFAVVSLGFVICLFFQPSLSSTYYSFFCFLQDHRDGESSDTDSCTSVFLILLTPPFPPHIIMYYVSSLVVPELIVGNKWL